MKISAFIKRIALAFTAFLLMVSSIACSKDEAILMYVPDGAPLIAAYSFFESEKTVSGVKIDAQIVTGAQIAPIVSGKQADIVLAPITICAESVANTGGEYAFLGTAVMGLNHIVTNVKDNAAHSLDELRGEVVYAFNKQGTPARTLKAILTDFDIQYNEFTDVDKTIKPDMVNIEYLPAAVDVRNAMTLGLEGNPASFYRYGLLAEPLATALTGQGGALERSFDLQQLWQQLYGQSYPQVGVLIKKSVIEKYEDIVEQLRDIFIQNHQHIKQNSSEVATKLKDEIGSSELPQSGVVAAFISGEKGEAAFTFSTQSIEDYLQALSIAVPPADFYIA